MYFHNKPTLNIEYIILFNIPEHPKTSLFSGIEQNSSTVLPTVHDRHRAVIPLQHNLSAKIAK